MSDTVAESLKLATWNLWWRFGDWRHRQEAITAVLDELGADVVGLQEVWSEGERDLASIVGDELGYERAFAASAMSPWRHGQVIEPGVGYGNAVLSRWPITATKTLSLPAAGAADEARTALFCDIATPFGTLPFVTTHLNSGWAQSSVRAAQLGCIGQRLVALERQAFPPVLTGDLNAGDDFDENPLAHGKARPARSRPCPRRCVVGSTSGRARLHLGRSQPARLSVPTAVRQGGLRLCGLP